MKSPPARFLLAALAIAACSNSKDSPPDGNAALVGRACESVVLVDAGVFDAATIGSVTGPVPECPFGACVLAPVQKPSAIAELCTAPCSSDTDCQGAIIGDASDPDDHRCKTRFVCMVPAIVGNYFCQKLCVCADSLDVPAGGFQTPSDCPDAGSSS